MGQYAKHVFICTYGPWCSRDGDTEAIAKRLKQATHAAGLKDQVRINKAGCLNQCGHGPMLVVYPVSRWYAGVRPEDADELVAAELVADQPLERLLYHAPPGDNKDLSGYPPDVIAAERAKKQDG